jgi:ankyrin repeat protein
MSGFELIQKCISGDIDGVKQLIADNADVNVFTDGNCPLLVAIRENNVDLLRILLQAGVDTARFWCHGETALVIAAAIADPQTVQCLVQHLPVAQLDTRSEYGPTALSVAIKNNRRDIVSILLDAGANVRTPLDHDYTLLMECRDVTLAKRLLELGVDLHAQDVNGMDALMHACSDGDADMVDMLLSRGADKTVRSGLGTSLMIACEEGRTEVVQALVQHDAPQSAADAADPESPWARWLNARTHRGDTALHVAVKGDHARCVRALINAGADINASGEGGSRPLHHAFDLEIARMLLDAGAEDGTDDQHRTVASHFIGFHDCVDVLTLFLQRFPDSEPAEGAYLVEALDFGSVEGLRAVLDARPPEYVNLPEDFPALCRCRDLEKMRLLLERGADPRIVDLEGQTPLMLTSSVACARLLLEAAPDMAGARDDLGRSTIAHLCCSKESYDVLKELLQYCEEHGVDVDVDSKDDNEDTALHMAMLVGMVPSVELLLEKGAGVLGVGLEGATVLMKPFISREDYMSEYRDRYGYPDTALANDSTRTDAEKDSVANACLRAVLDAALLRGGGEKTGGTAEAETEPTAKRRRM